MDQLLEVLLADLHHDVGEHLDEAAVAVPRPARVLGLLGERLDHGLVEAEVEDGVHHARHRRARAGADGDEQRVLGVAELLAGRLLELVDVLHDLRHDVVANLLAVVVVACTGLGRDGEALRHREPEARHLRQIRALAAQQLAHVRVAFGLAGSEEVDILLLILIHGFLFFLLFSFSFVNYTIIVLRMSTPTPGARVAPIELKYGELTNGFAHT